MKRSELKRRHLRVVDDPEREAWKTPVGGICANCADWFPRLERHHVVALERVKREGGRLWDFANSLLICKRCHEKHTNAFERLPISILTVANWDYAAELLGVEAGVDYLARFYRQSEPEVAA